MQRVTLRCYQELNDFLPPERRKRPFDVEFELPRSVKDLIESVGVPHVEVDLILVNGESVGFDYRISDGDRISVYPMFESFDIEGVTRLRPTPLREARFVLDVHLHTLARKLRMLGFDALYRNDADDDELAAVSASEERTLLTRDIGLLKRTEVTRGLYVRASDPKRQLVEVLDRLDLYGRIDPLSRCISCNGHIKVLEETAEHAALVRREAPPGVRSHLRSTTDFYRCESCGKLYWRGTHVDRMLEEIGRLRSRDCDER